MSDELVRHGPWTVNYRPHSGDAAVRPLYTRGQPSTMVPVTAKEVEANLEAYARRAIAPRAKIQVSSAGNQKATGDGGKCRGISEKLIIC